MTQEQINEGNKLIAEFMNRNHQSLYSFISQYEYHYSWDFLMPVVRKIVVLCVEFIKWYNNEKNRSKNSS